MRYLIAESVALNPHLETAGELALRFRDEGHEVSFTWLGDDLPWSDWSLPAVARLLGCSLERRVRRFMGLLGQEGIVVHDQVAPNDGRLGRALMWAADFRGDTEALKYYRLDSARLGMGAVSSLISLHGDSRYRADLSQEEVHQCLAAAALVYERARSVIEWVRPDVVVTFNGRFATSKPIVAAAEDFGIRTLRHERGSTFQRYEIFEDSVHSYAYRRQRIRDHWSSMPHEERTRNGHKFFERRRCGDGIGWYSFTDHQQRGRVPAKLDGVRRVVYFSSSDDEYAATTDKCESGPWSDQLAAVNALVRSIEAVLGIELIVRIHPHLSKKSIYERARWMRLAGANVRVIAPDDPVDSYALLDSADVIFSFGSTIGMEAAYWGKPSVLLAPCLYSDSPAVICPNSDTDVQALLSSSARLMPPSREQCLPYGNYFLSYGTSFKFYKPTSLSEGEFMGDRLGWDPAPVYWLRKQGLGKLYRSLAKKWI